MAGVVVRNIERAELTAGMRGLGIYEMRGKPQPMGLNYA